MINKIELKNIATYKSTSVIEPKAINFVYGGNGTGKTTLSRFIADETLSSDSKITWDNQSHEKVIFYNRDFVEHNFSEDKALPGIFTLGSESIELQKEISELKDMQNTQKEQQNKEEVSLSKLIENRKSINEEMKKKCWEIQVKYGSDFSEALTGYRSSKDKFFEKYMDVYSESKDSSALVPTFETIKEMYQAAYAKNAQKVEEYKILNLNLLVDLDNNELLSEIITGKADTPIGTFIQFLNSGDWVKQGIEYSKKTNGKCPYCQRELPEDIANQITDFFDEEYERKCALLSKYQSEYSTYGSNIKSQLDYISKNKYDFLQYEKYELLVEQFSSLLNSNLIVIQSKVDTPSKKVELSSLKDILEKINLVINEYNERIKKNNDIIENQDAAKKEVQSSVWSFIVEQLKDYIQDYKKRLSGIEQGIKNIESKIKEHLDKIKAFDIDIKEKESQLTSVTPTVKAINNILDGFGYSGFSLAENENKPGTYIIIRPDGTDASKTLSEGEHNFISFLYFYHLCFGSQTKTGITNDRILVIDDPISSLDSNVLFVIATLVKNIIQYCREGKKGIKQIFILTHNVYFHKEVSFLGSREHFSPSEVAYYVIRKKDENSSIVTFEDNPIKSSYELLWEDLRKPNESSVKSVFNTMRRILEHYFQVIGGIKYEECINAFEGEDKLICKALVAFINDGSHSIFDDLVVSFDETSLDNYLRVFRLIFVNLHHISHYNMMMRVESD